MDKSLIKRQFSPLHYAKWWNLSDMGNLFLSSQSNTHTRTNPIIIIFCVQINKFNLGDQARILLVQGFLLLVEKEILERTIRSPICISWLSRAVAILGNQSCYPNVISARAQWSLRSHIRIFGVTEHARPHTSSLYCAVTVRPSAIQDLRGDLRVFRSLIGLPRCHSSRRWAICMRRRL